MRIRPFQLPKDIDLMNSLVMEGFQYPENPAWSVQEDEIQGMVDRMNGAKRLWPVLQVMRIFVPLFRDVMCGFISEEDGQPAGLINYMRQRNAPEWYIANVTVLPAYRRRGLLNYHPPLPLAETASVFGELLVTRHLLAAEHDPQLRIALLCAKLEEIIATTFRQAMLTRFEQAAHARRAGGLLSADDLCDLWLAENGKLFGSEVTMITAYRWGWSYISHFIHARFYCFSYVFGELLVLALYRKYLEEGPTFAPRYLELLRAGGSASPTELLRPLGIDLADPHFWGGGYAVVGEMLEELQTLVRGEE